MICETRRAEVGLLTVVGDRESWGKDGAHVELVFSKENISI